ncbi:MAG: hypothetical protein H6849_03820 [Alphaproteobacteria bacterium]|nr:MAG: hypothetical protein H6849_03820 [Alphaproteobacteria bacterium]
MADNNKKSYKLVILKPGEATEWGFAINDNTNGSTSSIRKIILWIGFTASAVGSMYFLG